MQLRLTSLFGLCVMTVVAWGLSSNRRKIDKRIIIGGLFLQFTFALIVFRTDLGRAFFDSAGTLFKNILDCTDAGSQFVFGKNFGAELPETLFVFRVLPVIIFFSSLMSVLHHYGIVQIVVRGLGWVMQRTLGTSGAESLAAAANIFFGQTESPLVIKPYLSRMTNSELMSLMVGGFATIAGSVMALYAGFGIDAGHLLTASVISAPAALLIAKIMQPEVETPLTAGSAQIDLPRETTNVMDALTTGATDGLKLALTVAAMIIAFLAMIALINLGLQTVHEDLSFSIIVGRLFEPLAWCMGIDPVDTRRVGELIGTKIVANELIAYHDLANMTKNQLISTRSEIIATYALCGFANFGSIGIQIGGISAIVPERKADLAQLGFRAMIGGTLAGFMTACIAGILL
ncbi:MAG: nucleoside transporter C-terminal domain-containing protein [Planctomycetaceae bacterium]